MRGILTLAVAVVLSTQSFAQVFTNKEVGKKNEALVDSLKTAKYPYVLPIWGAKATNKGFNLPYSAGLSVQYFRQESLIIIDNLLVGFNNGPMYNLDGIVRFDEAKAKASAFTFRPDIWLFPFLNIYAIFGTASASTQVDFGVWVPDSMGVSHEIYNTGTVVEFTTTTAGFGITPTIGVAGGFIALDMNLAWTDVPQLAQPARSFVFGPRFGKNFKFNKPEQSIAVWVGGFRVNIRSGTEGSIALSEVMGDDSELSGNIDEAQNQVNEYQNQVDTWWNNLSEFEQNQLVNQRRYEAANNALGRAADVLNAAEDAVTNVSTSTVQYSMDKTLKDNWNLIVGSQFQYNKHWMMRLEFGFLGSRTQGMVGLQYRFGL